MRRTFRLPSDLLSESMVVVILPLSIRGISRVVVENCNHVYLGKSSYIKAAYRGSIRGKRNSVVNIVTNSIHIGIRHTNVNKYIDSVNAISQAGFDLDDPDVHDLIIKLENYFKGV